MEWLLPLAAGGLLVVFVVGRGRSRRRAGELRAWAEQRGLDFAPGPDRRVGITFLELPLIGGRRAGARNHVCGRWRGREIHVFDLVVGPDEDAEGDDHATSRHTCILVKANLPLIPLCVRPRGAGDQPPTDPGPRPIPLSVASFEDVFDVCSPDQRWARDLLHPQAVADLLAGPRWRLELGGWYCLVAAQGRLGADRLDEALGMAASFLDAIPEATRREILGEASPGRASAD